MTDHRPDGGGAASIADPGAWRRGHRGRVTTAPAVDPGEEHGRALWRASCSCGWSADPHTRDTNAARALRRHLAEVMLEALDAR